MRSAACFLVLLLLAPAAVAQDQLKAYPVEPYTLHTDLQPREVKRLKRFLKGMQRTYKGVFAKDGVREVDPPQVRVFTLKADYERYGRADRQVRFNTNWRGYYARARNELVSYRGPKGLPDLFSILSHEGFHQFAWEFIVPKKSGLLPQWYEEGLAEYFRASGLRSGKLKFRRYWSHYRLVQRAIREGWVWTRAQLWACDPAKLEDEARFNAFYAHAYVFVDFLITRRREQVKEIYRLKREGLQTDEVLNRVFPPKQRERLYQAFLEHARSAK